MNQQRPDLILTEEQFRSSVSDLLGRDISRSLLYERRQELAPRAEEFTLAYARVVAFYCRKRASRIKPDVAKQLTIAFAKENNL